MDQCVEVTAVNQGVEVTAPGSTHLNRGAVLSRFGDLRHAAASSGWFGLLLQCGGLAVGSFDA